MAIAESKMLDPDFERVHFSTEEDAHSQNLPAAEIIDMVNQILGYDIRSREHLMEEGYREFASEQLAISESTLVVFEETLPEE